MEAIGVCNGLRCVDASLSTLLTVLTLLIDCIDGYLTAIGRLLDGYRHHLLTPLLTLLTKLSLLLHNTIDAIVDVRRSC